MSKWEQDETNIEQAHKKGLPFPTSFLVFVFLVGLLFLFLSLHIHAKNEMDSEEKTCSSSVFFLSLSDICATLSISQ
jgi:hypothetical protein